MSVDVGGEVAQERCIPIPRRMRIRLVAIGTRWKDISMVVGVQRIGNRPMTTCTWYSGDNLDTKAINFSQQKMTKKQWTRIRPMATGTKHAEFGPTVGTNFYLKRVQQIDKSLIIAST